MYRGSRLIRARFISASHSLNDATTPQVTNLLRLTRSRRAIRRRRIRPRFVQVVRADKLRMCAHQSRNLIPEGGIERSGRRPRIIGIIGCASGIEGLPWNMGVVFSG